MSDVQDRLRQDLPALADALIAGRAADSAEVEEPEGAADAVAQDPGPFVGLGSLPVGRKRRWPAVAAAAAAVAAVVGVGAFLLNTTDSTRVTTVGPSATRPGAAPETMAPAGAPESSAPAPVAGTQVDPPAESAVPDPPAESAAPEAPVAPVSGALAEVDAHTPEHGSEPKASVDEASGETSASSASGSSGADVESEDAATIGGSGIGWEDLEGLAFEVDSATIQLSGGSASVSYGGESSDVYTLQDRVAAGDLDGDGDDDVVAHVVLRTGGTGVFHFLIPVIDDDGVPAAWPAVWVGDRVVVESILVRDARVEVTLLNRAVDESYTVISRRETLEIDLSGPQPLKRSLGIGPIDDPPPAETAPLPEPDPESEPAVEPG